MPRIASILVAAACALLCVVQHFQMEHVLQAQEASNQLFSGMSVAQLEGQFGEARWASDEPDFISHYTGVHRTALDDAGITEARRYSLGTTPQMIWLEVFIADGKILWARIRFG